jgi:hypothetical protein
MNEKEKSQKAMNRREFMKTGAIAMGAAMTSGFVLPNLAKRAEAAKRDYIRPPDRWLLSGRERRGSTRGC